MAETVWNIANLYTAMKEAFNEDMPCEVSGHDTDPGHSGTGEWYVSYLCPSCQSSGTDFICEGFVLLIVANLGATVPCKECEKRTMLGKAITSMTRR